MNYEIRKELSNFILYLEGKEIGVLTVEPVSHNINGHVNEYGTISFVPKGFLFWYSWIYSENDNIKYIFKINNWRTLTFKNREYCIELNDGNIKVKGDILCSINRHVNDAVLDKKLFTRLINKQKDIHTQLNEKPLYTFNLNKRGYLPFVFASCVQQWVDVTL